MFVAAALLLAAPALADGNGKGGNNGNGNDKVSDNKPPKKNHRPTAKVQGDYAIRIAGYYSGAGTGSATGAGIKISAKVKDPAGNQYDLQAKQLSVVDDRFSGIGSLGGVEVRIDGRLDPRDATGNNGVKGNEVLKKGRMTFTFSANGHHARGAGEQKPGSGTSGSD
jgi:hypothetical protein